MDTSTMKPEISENLRPAFEKLKKLMKENELTLYRISEMLDRKSFSCDIWETQLAKDLEVSENDLNQLIGEMVQLVQWLEDNGIEIWMQAWKVDQKIQDEKVERLEVEVIYHQLYAIRAGLTLRNPIVQVFMSKVAPDCVAAVPLNMDLPYSEWGPTVTINDTYRVLMDTATHLSK